MNVFPDAGNARGYAALQSVLNYPLSKQTPTIKQGQSTADSSGFEGQVIGWSGRGGA
jgi:hypothetical protein